MSKVLPTKVCAAAVNVAAKEFDVGPLDIMGDGQTRQVVYARHFAMWLLRQMEFSLPEIGRRLGNHHTTVLNGIRAHDARLKSGELSHSSVSIGVERLEHSQNVGLDIMAKRGSIAA